MPRLPAALALLLAAGLAPAQSVGLPTPRLLTTVPMGARAGTEVEVVISGEHLDGATALVFSDPRLTARPKPGDASRYVVAVSADCPEGVYEARALTAFGASSPRLFSVGRLPEVAPAKPNRAPEAALELPLGCVCNAAVAARAVDFYTFRARKGQRIAVDCAARGIDSKLTPTVIVTDAAWRDLAVERRGGPVDFTAPVDGVYGIKVHDLTFKGGPSHFYRLTLRELPPGAAVPRHPVSRPVNAFSWPPVGLPDAAPLTEVEPNGDRPQRVALPLDVAGRFFPAADVDAYEFDAKKGDEWWVEVASERLGHPTDPSAVVQRVGANGELADVVELTDVPSPVKVSSNAYAYDGPPYNAGTSDFLAKFTAPDDGTYRLRLSDLYGGTRTDPTHAYRLTIRRAAPDFALVAWPIHMELRNGDRNALSKPVSLRRGATAALEVVAFRRDGFDGPIELFAHDLPAGVTACGLTIPAGQSRGALLFTAADDAAPGFALASLAGKATVGGAPVTRPCHLATLSWPVPDSWSELPAPRLSADAAVSVGVAERAPLTVRPKSAVLTAVVGTTLAVPFVQSRSDDFAGRSVPMKGAGPGFERAKFDLPLGAATSEAKLDLKALNLPVGEHRLAFVGGAVAKHRHRPDLMADAELAASRLAARAALAGGPAARELADAGRRMEQMRAASAPKDVAEIIVTEPVTIRVLPAEAK